MMDSYGCDLDKPNAFETALGISRPKCCSSGDCCKGASPSVPFLKLLEKAAQGDTFARQFFDMMVPYPSHEAARAVVPGIVEKSLRAIATNPDYAGPEDLVFYRCRHLQDDNRCGIYETRPQFCRDYPDTPFIVMAPGCAYVPWAKACKAEKQKLDETLATLKTAKTALQMGQLPAPDILAAFNTPAAQDASWLHNFAVVLSLTPLYLASPFLSFWWSPGQSFPGSVPV